MLQAMVADAYVAFGNSHPLEVSTLSGETVTVTNWGASDDIRIPLLAQHPHLGAATINELELATSDGNPFDPVHGSSGWQLVAGMLDYQVQLTDAIVDRVNAVHPRSLATIITGTRLISYRLSEHDFFVPLSLASSHMSTHMRCDLSPSLLHCLDI